MIFMEEAHSASYFSDILIVLTLILFNGLLAMAELAIVSSNRNKLQSLASTSPGAKAALDLLANPGPLLSTIQIGITVIGIISGVFGGHKFAAPLANYLDGFPILNGRGEVIAYTTVVMIITYLSIVFGELIPKRIGISKAEQLAIIFSRPIQVLAYVTHPFVVILDGSSKAILKLIKQGEAKDSSLTEEEIKSVMKEGLEHGAIDHFEHKVFQRVLQFGEREASLIMTPRIKLIYLNIADGIEFNLQKIIDNPHRYYPVCDGELDNFKGILDSKDLLSLLIQGNKIDLASLVREAPCVIEDNVGPDLLEHMRRFKTHIAIVVDEYGALQGIITLVDIFYNLIGTVPESQQAKHYEIITRSDNSWLCDGLTPIHEIEELLQLKITDELEDDFSTLAGFLLIHFKHIPRAGEIIEWNGFRFEIMDMDSSRIDKVLISRQAKP